MLDSLFSKIKNAFVGTATPYYLAEGHFYLESNNVKNGQINRNSEIFINDFFYKKQEDNWLHTDDIVMVQSGHVGHSAVIPPELNNTAAHALIIFADKKKKICSYFLNYQFQTDITKALISNITTGNTIKHILSSEMKKFKVILPQATEQIQIGSYFQNLDKLISLHQAKYNKLVNLKKAMLEKMFPKHGEDEPEIRFKGFEGAWEEKELGKVAEVRTGFPFDSNEFGYDGEYLVITNGNIQNESPYVDITTGNRISIRNETVIREYVLNLNDILVTMDGTVGRTAKVVNRNQILAQRVGRLTANSNSDFLYYVLNTGDFYKNMVLISSGGTIKHISLNEISSYLIKLPKFKEEEQKVGSYFQNLDKLITLHQNELDKLNHLKKACLEQMFV